MSARLSLEREALLRSPYLHGLTHEVLSKTIGDFGLTPAATAVIGRGLRDRTGSARSRRNGATPEAAGRNNGRPQLLFVGRIERRKGVDTLLDAVGMLLDQGLEFELQLVGPDTDPSFRVRLEREAAQRPRLAHAIGFAGAVSDAQLAQLYADADIVCVPSRYESHGVVVVEAMMFGKPVVICGTGGIGEVVDPGQTALVSPPESPSELAGSIRRLLADDDVRAELGAAARATFERRFESRLVAREMQSFLVDVVSAHRAASRTRRGVKSGLEQLLGAAFSISPEATPAVAAELVDAADGEPLRRLRAAARQSPATRRQNAPDQPSPPAPRVTAIVLTRDRGELLARAVDSVQMSGTQAEIVVIDNASSPGHARRVAAICADREHARLRRSERNLGTGGGRRLAAESVDTELVLFLDDDAELLPGALDHLVAELDDHPSVGAVTATVVSSDGVVSHSGGTLERSDGAIIFDLVGTGLEFGTEELPPSGPAGWVPGTAVLARRKLLEDFPVDQEMAAYFEDNEWCYRISLERPGSFRRSREALVFHQLALKTPTRNLASNERRIELLGAATHFYRRHGVVMGPWAFDSVLPELRANDGTSDFASARLLMELLTAKGPEWTLAAWNSGELTGLLSSHRRRADLADARTEIERLRQAIAAQEETMFFLYQRHQTLCRVEQGGWWRLRGRILPLIRLAGALRRRLRRLSRRPDETPLA